MMCLIALGILKVCREQILGIHKGMILLKALHFSVYSG